MNDSSTPALWMGVFAHEVEPVVFLVAAYPDDVIKHVALNCDQAVDTAQRILDAVTVIDARTSERAALDSLYALQAESPEHDHTDRP